MLSWYTNTWTPNHVGGKHFNHPATTEKHPDPSCNTKTIQLRLGWCITSEHIQILRAKITYFNTHQGRVIPVHAYYRARGFRERLRSPELECGKVFSPVHRMPLTSNSRKYSCYSFLLEVESNSGS